MTQTNGRHDIEEIVARELDEYQQSLFGKLTPASDQSILKLPIEVQERIRRAKLCLAMLHSMRNSSQDLSRSPASHPNQHLPKAVGRFEIRDQLGVGGFGIVYRAYDPITKRDVALKIPRIDAMASEDLRKRFELEATAAGKLDHPNIIPILEAGAAGPIPYIASAYYDGPDLAKWMHRHPGPTSMKAAVELVRQLALAVENAHKHGVLHRDIKPSNVLLAQVDPTHPTDDLDSYTPKLMDFGLAKIAELAGDVTLTGAILGTCKYMAPEQAEGKHSEITTATDVYALGGLLFELLTGRPPFDGDAPTSVLFKVIHDEVPDVRTLRKDTPLDLSVIVTKCLSKSKADRYSSAQELADELGRFLSGTPINARPVIWWERLWKWSRRRPAQASATFLAVLFPATVLILSLLANRILLRKNQEISQKNQEIARRLYSADMRSAKQAVDDHRVEEAVNILRKYEPASSKQDVRTLPWHLLASSVEPKAIVEWKLHNVDIYSIAVSPNRELLATASRDGTACLWKFGTKQLVHRLVGHERDVNVVLFSPNGSRIVTCGDDGTIRQWDCTSGMPLLTIDARQGAVSSLVFSNDGKHLASGGADGIVRIWDAKTGMEIRTICSSEGAIDAIAYSPNGRSLIVASKNKGLFCIDAGTGQSIWQIPINENDPLRFAAIAIHSGLNLVVGCGLYGNVYYFDLSTGEMRQTTHDGRSSGSAITIASNNMDVIVADKSGRLERTPVLIDSSPIPISAGRSRIWAIVTLETDGTILTANASGIVRIEKTHLNQDAETRSLTMLDGGIEDMFVAPKSNRLYAAGGRSLTVINPTNGRFLQSKRDFSSNVLALAVNNEESIVAAGEQSGRISLWNADSFELVDNCPTIGVHENEKPVGIETVQFIPGKPWIVYVTDSDRLLRVWDYKRKSVVWETNIDGGTVLNIAILPNGQILVACRHTMYGFTPDGMAYKPLLNEPSFTYTTRVRALSDRGIVSCQRVGRVRLNLVPSFKEHYLTRLAPTSSSIDMDLSPSKEWVAVGGSLGDVFLIHTSKLIVFSTTIVGNADVRTVCFSNDETEIYAGLDDGRIVATRRIREGANQYIKPVTPMTSISLSPDGELLAFHSMGQHCRLIRTKSMSPVISWLEREFDRASFSPDGLELIVTKKNRIFVAHTKSLEADAKAIREIDSEIVDLMHISNTKLLIRCEDMSFRIIAMYEPTKDFVLGRMSDTVAERLVLSEDGEQLAVATSDRKIRIWNLRDMRGSVIDAPDTVRSLAFAPDGEELAVGGEHGTIDLLSLQTKEWLEPLVHPGNVEIRSIKFTDNGRTLLAANSASGILIWDLETREAIYTFDSDLRVEDIEINKDCDTIAICGNDSYQRGYVRLHRLSCPIHSPQSKNMSTLND